MNRRRKCAFREKEPKKTLNQIINSLLFILLRNQLDGNLNRRKVALSKTFTGLTI